MFVGWNLLRGRTGRASWRSATTRSPPRPWASTRALYKTLTFGVSALFTGIAGALGAIAVQFVAPDSFTISLSITFLVGIVVGGLGSMPGAVFGAIFISSCPTSPSRFPRPRRGRSTASSCCCIIFLMPAGVAGLCARSAGRGVERLAGLRDQTLGSERTEGCHQQRESSMTRQHDPRRRHGGTGLRALAGAGRAQEIRPRRHRYRNQDRQHHAL